ncbi:Hypothetical protein FKW44_016425, partial [Caligus rogercresseyi]
KLTAWNRNIFPEIFHILKHIPFSGNFCEEIYKLRDSLIWGSSRPYISRKRLNSS